MTTSTDDIYEPLKRHIIDQKQNIAQLETDLERTRERLGDAERSSKATRVAHWIREIEKMQLMLIDNPDAVPWALGVLRFEMGILGYAGITTQTPPTDDDIQRMRKARETSIEDDFGWQVCMRALGLDVMSTVEVLTRDEARTLCARMLAKEAP